MLTDTRRAIRALVRARWATMLQLSTIAVGVGGLSAVFAVVGAVVLRPLPFDKPGELVTIDVTSSRGFSVSTSMPNYRDWRDRSKTLAVYGGFTGWTFRLARSGETKSWMAPPSTETSSACCAFGRRWVACFSPERPSRAHRRWSCQSPASLYDVQPLEPSIYAWCAAGVLAVTGLALLLRALASRRFAPAAVLRED